MKFFQWTILAKPHGSLSMLVRAFTTAVANEVVQNVIENDKRPSVEEGVHGS